MRKPFMTRWTQPWTHSSLTTSAGSRPCFIPATRMFRNHLSACFDNLLKSFPRNAVLAATGLPSHPRDFSLADPEFFVFVCSHAKDLDPIFIGDPKYLPLKIHGSIFENDSAAYVIYSYSGNVRTARTDFDYIQPGNLTFRKAKGQWLVYSSFLSRRVSDFWWIQLAKPKETPQRSARPPSRPPHSRNPSQRNQGPGSKAPAISGKPGARGLGLYVGKAEGGGDGPWRSPSSDPRRTHPLHFEKTGRQMAGGPRREYAFHGLKPEIGYQTKAYEQDHCLSGTGIHRLRLETEDGFPSA